MMCCNNKQALLLSSHHKGRIRPSAKCDDIRRSFRATKQTYQGVFKYIHVYGHMDQHLSWLHFSITQLNCECNTLAKCALTMAIIKGCHEGQAQTHPRKDVSLIVGATKSLATSLAHSGSTQARQLPVNTIYTSGRKASGHMSNSRK